MIGALSSGKAAWAMPSDQRSQNGIAPNQGSARSSVVSGSHR